MASLNRLFLIGNLTKDPELKYIPSGKAVATLRVACSEKYRTAAGEQKEDVLFIDAIVWGKQAENCAQYLKKGRPVFVEGRLKVRDYEARDGSKRRVVEVIANRVQFLGSAQGGGGGGAPRGGGGGYEEQGAGPEYGGAQGEAPEEPLPALDEEV